MNREIKFRGKVKYNGNHYDSGDWVKGTGIKLEGDKTFIFDDEENYVNGLGDFTRYGWVEVIPETVGQFTGLKDKNGKEIYEGDILERVLRGEKRVLVCSWKDDNYCFKFKDIKYPHTYHCSLEYDTVVIGNIQDNPELLEK